MLLLGNVGQADQMAQQRDCRQQQRGRQRRGQGERGCEDHQDPTQTHDQWAQRIALVVGVVIDDRSRERGAGREGRPSGRVHRPETGQGHARHSRCQQSEADGKDLPRRNPA